MKNRKYSIILCIGFLTLARLSAGAQEFIWEQTNGPCCGEIERLFVTPQGTLLASTRMNKFFRSQDGGNSWTQSSTGLTYRTSGKERVPAVLAMSFMGNTIYAGTEQAGIFRSDDDGKSWKLVNARVARGVPITPNEASMVSSLIIMEDIIIAGTMVGIYRSVDKGMTWTQVSEALVRGGQLKMVHSLVNVGHVLYAAAESEILCSADKGVSWHPTDFSASTVLVARTDGTLYTGTWDGISRSKDEGKSWEDVNTGLPKRRQFGGFPDIYSLAEVGKKLYAGTDRGVFRWEDNTNTWVQMGLENFSVYSCAATSKSFYAGTYGGGVFRLDDGEDNWIPANTGLIASFVYSLADIDGSIYAGTYGGGVFRSEDRGDSWIPINSGLSDTFVRSLGVIDGFLHAGTRSGDVFRLDDDSWTLTNLSDKVFMKLFIKVGERLYATKLNNVLCSEDGGETWTPAGNGLPQRSFYIRSLESFGGNVYVISSQGIYLLEDGGDTWNDINTGLTDHYVKSLAMAGDTLYAGTEGDGVFRAHFGRLR